MTGTDGRLDEIEGRVNAASPAPWPHSETLWAGRAVDAEFIAAAREDVPWLIRELRDARAENERLTIRVETQEQLYDELRDERAELWPKAQVLPEVERQLAAERAKVQRALATCDVFGDEYYALRQSILVALAGDEQR